MVRASHLLLLGREGEACRGNELKKACRDALSEWQRSKIRSHIMRRGSEEVRIMRMDVKSSMEDQADVTTEVKKPSTLH